MLQAAENTAAATTMFAYHHQQQQQQLHQQPTQQQQLSQHSVHMWSQPLPPLTLPPPQPQTVTTPTSSITSLMEMHFNKPQDEGTFHHPPTPLQYTNITQRSIPPQAQLQLQQQQHPFERQTSQLHPPHHQSPIIPPQTLQQQQQQQQKTQHDSRDQVNF